MTRVEKQTDVKEEIVKMKGEVVKEVQRKSRKHRPAITCGVIVIGLFLAAGTWVAWIIAGTGLLHVPVFTALAYEKPVPVRVVEAGTPLEDLVEADLESTLVQRLQSGGGQLTDTSVQIEASEESLTATLRSAAEEMNLPKIDPSHAQVTVQEDAGFEIFFPIKDNPQETALVISFHAKTTDRQLVLELQSVEIGSVSLPSFIITHGLEPVLDKYLDELNEALSTYIYISSFTYHEGWVEIDGEFAVEIQDGSTSL